jgi:uncharacterized membrane protein YgcG
MRPLFIFQVSQASTQSLTVILLLVLSIPVGLYLWHVVSIYRSNRKARQAAIRIKNGTPQGDYETAVFLLEQERAKKCKPITKRPEPACQVMSAEEVAKLRMEDPAVTAANKKALDNYRVAPKQDNSYDLVTPLVVASMLDNSDRGSSYDTGCSSSNNGYSSSSNCDYSSGGGGGDFGEGGSSGDY